MHHFIQEALAAVLCCNPPSLIPAAPAAAVAACNTFISVWGLQFRGMSPFFLVLHFSSLVHLLPINSERCIGH